SHKDLNDWMRAGATSKDLLEAMKHAETICKPSAQEILGQQSADTESEPEPDERLPDFPAECLPPILQREACAISELCGVPLAMSAPMVLAVASATIGKG